MTAPKKPSPQRKSKRAARSDHHFKLIEQLKIKFECSSDRALMDHLQLELGIVADNAITIDDCASRDLFRALQAPL